ncbi:Uncharacterized protein dnm_082850 [Desulfonema magnum]|uniref:Uncharacterized protein n=1 Tax=Desulfonema magnum TaxID=45655 RepID=A0A975BUX6_9BACT|nr:Uncharacterized protein dnm_082850 [Desulfonema magnum]
MKVSDMGQRIIKVSIPEKTFKFHIPLRAKHVQKSVKLTVWQYVHTLADKQGFCH